MSTTKRIVRIAFFIVLTIIGGKITIPLGYVPVTLQTFFVIAAGMFLGSVDGAICLICYMLLGLFGLPVFSSGGGFGYVFLPSFGYIIGFVAGAFISGLSKKENKKIWEIILYSLLGLLAVYIIGMSYQVIILISVNGLEFSSAIATLLPLLFMLAVDCAEIIILSAVYKPISVAISSHK